MNPQIVASINTQQITAQITPVTISAAITATGPQGPPGASTGDKNFIQAFATTTSLTVTHNLGKFPSVTVVDTAGDECEGFVQHLSVNTLSVLFTAAFSGTIYCN